MLGFCNSVKLPSNSLQGGAIYTTSAVSSNSYPNYQLTIQFMIRIFTITQANITTHHSLTLDPNWMTDRRDVTKTAYTNRQSFTCLRYALHSGALSTTIAPLHLAPLDHSPPTWQAGKAGTLCVYELCCCVCGLALVCNTLGDLLHRFAGSREHKCISV